MTRTFFSICFLGLLIFTPALCQAGDLPGGEEAKKRVEARRGKTELSKLALSMKPGTWAELKPGPGDLRKAPLPSKGLDIGTWTDDGHWDSRTGQFLFLGVRQTRRFIAYSEEKNAWRDLGLPADHEAANSPSVAVLGGHIYSRNALDPETSRFYHMAGGDGTNDPRGGIVHRYDLATGKWAKLPPGGSREMTSTIEYFSAMKGLVQYGRGAGGVWFFSDEKQAWSLLGKVPLHGYHTQGRHNPYREEVLLAGGNESRRTVVVLGKDGKFKQLKDSPVDLHIQGSKIVADPVSGRYLILSKRQFYELDSAKNEYRLIEDFNKTSWPFDASLLTASIPEYGVTMWVGRNKVWLYKHDAAK